MSYELSRRYTKCVPRGISCLRAEHSYSKFNWSSGESHLPTIYLFTEKKCRHFSSECSKEDFNHIDIESFESGNEDVEDGKKDGYNLKKAQHSMEECERYAQLVEIDGDSDNEMESPYSGNTLCCSERRLYRKILEILKSERLSRLAYKKLPNEAILRRINLNKRAHLIKRLLSDVKWDPLVTSKLHLKLITSIPRSLLPIYLDVLQTLMAEIPKLIEPMLRAHMSRLNISANEAMDLLLGTPWCPVSEHINKQALALHPSIRAPTFLFICDVPSSKETVEWSRRRRFFSRQLASIGHVLKVLDLGKVQKSTMDPEEMVEVCLRRIARKVAETRGSSHNSPVVLIGRSYTSLLACEVSTMESVDAVACLGFPTPNPWPDHVQNFYTPTLFIVGDRDRSCPIERLEKFRATFKATTGLVVVGGADDQLRISRSKQMIEEVLQPMADRCMMEKLAEFLSIVLR